MSAPKKIIEPTSQMDVYSFGIIMWEIWHEHIPFDGDLQMAIKYVFEETSRPMINSQEDKVCSDSYASLIRQCW